MWQRKSGKESKRPLCQFSLKLILLGLALKLKINRTIIERILAKELKTKEGTKTPKSCNNKSVVNRHPSLSSFGFRQ